MQNTPTASAQDGPRRYIPFGAHQGVEYIMAILLAGVAIHLSGDMEWALLGGALAIFLLSFLTKAPLGGGRIVAMKVHLVLDLAIAVGLALSPLIATSGVDATGIITAEATAVLLARMSTLTRKQPRPRKTPRSASPGEPSSRARPTPQPPESPSEWDPSRRPSGQTTSSSGEFTSLQPAPPSPREIKVMATARAFGYVAGRARRLRNQ